MLFSSSSFFSFLTWNITHDTRQVVIRLDWKTKSKPKRSEAEVRVAPSSRARLDSLLLWKGPTGSGPSISTASLGLPPSFGYPLEWMTSCGLRRVRNITWHHHHHHHQNRLSTSGAPGCKRRLALISLRPLLSSPCPAQPTPVGRTR